MNFLKRYWILFVIILLAFVLRFYNVSSDPPSLNWDEVSIGYNGYSILKTGKDEWGEFLPIHFKSYGEYKLPAQIYISIPAIALFGLNDFGVRVTPVIYGTLTVLLLFLLTLEIFEGYKIALVSSFLLAISPWHIQFTRASFESSFALFWIVLGIWLLVKGFKVSKWLLYSTIPFAISLYTYNSSRVFIPIFLLITLLTNFQYFRRNLKITLLSLLLFSLLVTPLVPFILGGGVDARYKLVSITDDPGLVLRINEIRGNSSLPFILPRLLFNKVTFVSLTFIDHYLAHFTPNFLFIAGAPHKQHSVQGMGELYLFEAPFLVFGLFLLFWKKRRFRYLLLFWLLLGFIPAAITNDTIPNALRTLNVVPVPQILVAFGLIEFYKRVKSNKVSLVIFLVILPAIVAVSIFSYLDNYFDTYPSKYSRDWQYGYKEVLSYVKNNQSKYDVVVMTNEYGQPYMFALFYLKFDPEKFQSSPNLIRYSTSDFTKVDQFDKYYFTDMSKISFNDLIARFPNKKVLIIGKISEIPQDKVHLLNVNFLDGTSAFVISKNG